MVERRLKEALKNDRARIQVGHISHFGLLEMSRQRLRPSLAETSFIICPHCGGTGHVRSHRKRRHACAARASRRRARKRRAAEIVVHVAGAVALYILNHKRDRLGEIEQRYAHACDVPGRQRTRRTADADRPRARPGTGRRRAITPHAAPVLPRAAEPGRRRKRRTYPTKRTPPKPRRTAASSPRLLWRAEARAAMSSRAGGGAGGGAADAGRRVRPTRSRDWHRRPPKRHCPATLFPRNSRPGTMRDGRRHRRSGAGRCGHGRPRRRRRARAAGAGGAAAGGVGAPPRRTSHPSRNSARSSPNCRRPPIRVRRPPIRSVAGRTDIFDVIDQAEQTRPEAPLPSAPSPGREPGAGPSRAIRRGRAGT